MAEVRVPLPSFRKEVLVKIPDTGDLKENFNEAASYVRMLEESNKIRDFEQGINPPGATHEIVKDKKGNYRLNRFRFG